MTTSGGTESILMACYGARQKAYAERGVTEPEMYVSSSITKCCPITRVLDFVEQLSSNRLIIVVITIKVASVSSQ